MISRIPLLLSAVVLFAAIAFVFVLLAAGIVTGGLDFPGEPEVADAEKDMALVIGALRGA